MSIVKLFVQEYPPALLNPENLTIPQNFLTKFEQRSSGNFPPHLTFGDLNGLNEMLVRDGTANVIDGIKYISDISKLYSNALNCRVRALRTGFFAAPLKVNGSSQSSSLSPPSVTAKIGNTKRNIADIHHSRPTPRIQHSQAI